jgi:hypothetical protein
MSLFYFTASGDVTERSLLVQGHVNQVSMASSLVMTSYVNDAMLERQLVAITLHVCQCATLSKKSARNQN